MATFFNLVQHDVGLFLIPFPETVEVGDLLFFFFGGAADHFLWHDGRTSFLVEESVYADDGQFAAMLEAFVVETFFLDLVALVHAFHGAQYAAAVQ